MASKHFISPISAPQLQAVACSFVEGSLGFLSGIVSLAELIPLARQHRDKMLTKVTCAVAPVCAPPTLCLNILPAPVKSCRTVTAVLGHSMDQVAAGTVMTAACSCNRSVSNLDPVQHASCNMSCATHHKTRTCCIA